VKYVKKESPVQSLYTADELAQQNTIHDDGGASNHPGPAVHQGNSELQAAGYANEMPGPNQAPCLNAMLRMSPAPHAWASPAMLAAKSKRNKEWRVCSIHGYPTHGSLFEQVSPGLVLMLWQRLQPCLPQLRLQTSYCLCWSPNCGLAGNGGRRGERSKPYTISLDSLLSAFSPFIPHYLRVDIFSTIQVPMALATRP